MRRTIDRLPRAGSEAGPAPLRSAAVTYEELLREPGVEIDLAEAGDGQQRLRAVLGALELPSLRLRGSGPGKSDSTDTRLGGLPMLAPDAAWPHSPDGRAQTFLGQLNCNDVNTHMGTANLPADTVLAFFYDLDEQPWGFDPADAGRWRVLATPLAEAVAVPPAAPTESFDSVALTGVVVRTVPDPWEPVLGELPEEERELLEGFHDALESTDEPPRHRVFGWPEPVQNPMQLDCQLAANDVYCGRPEDYEGARVVELSPGAADWVLLWQLDSDDDAGWMWGDLGTIYYWIRRQDLAAGDFDRVWLILQCS